MNKKVKVMLSLFLSTVLVFSLGGCGKSKSSEEINLMTWADFIPRAL